MNRTFHKRCPKCGGKVLLDKDYHGWYEECLQCGYTCDMHEVIERPVWHGADEAEAVPARGQ